MNQKDDYNAIAVFGDGKAYATINFSNLSQQSLTVTNADIAENGLTISGNSCNGNLIEIGNCNASEISLTLENADGRFNSYDFLKSTAEVLIGSDNAPINLMPIINYTESDYTVTTTEDGYLVHPDGSAVISFSFPTMFLYADRQVKVTYESVSGITVGYKDSESQHTIVSGETFYPPEDGFAIYCESSSAVSSDFYLKIMLQYGNEDYISPISYNNRTHMDYLIGYFGIDRVSVVDKSIILNGLDSLCALDTTIRGLKDFTVPGYRVKSNDCTVRNSPSKTTSTSIGTTGLYVSGDIETTTYNIVEIFEDGDLWGRLSPTDTIVQGGSNVNAGDSAWICLTGFNDNNLTIYPVEWQPMLFEPGSLRVSVADLLSTDLENDNPYNFIFPVITGDVWTLLSNIKVNVFRLNGNTTMRQLLASALAVTQNNALVSGDNVLQIGWYTDYSEPQRLYTKSTVFSSEFNETEIGITGVKYTINGEELTFGSGDYQIIIPESDALNAIAKVNGYDTVYHLRYNVNWAGLWTFTYTPFTLRVLPCPINRNMLTMYYGRIVDGEYYFDKKCPVTDWVWTMHGATVMQGKGEMNNSISQNTVTSAQNPVDPFLSADSESPVQNKVITGALSAKKDLQTAVESPTASGTAASFIYSITQNEQGVITPTKRSVRTATQSQSGLMSAEDKVAVDGLAVKEIVSNTDLDNCMDVGVWNCYSSTVAATLTNSPITNAGFPMLVYQVGAGNARIQVIFGGSAIYSRRRTTSSWGRWYTFNGA